MEFVKETLSFYTPYADIERMETALKMVLQDQLQSYTNKNNELHIQLQNREYLHIPYVSVNTNSETFRTQIQLLYASTEKCRSDNVFIKQNLLYQIALFRAAYVFEFNYEVHHRDEKILPLMEIADQMDALIFWETGDISDSYGDVVLSRKGTSEVAVFNPVDGFDFTNRALGLSEIELKRIHRSMTLLRYKGIYAPNNIAPPFDEKMHIYQELEDVVKRSIACMLLGIYTDFLYNHQGNAMLAYEDVEKMIRMYRASPFFTIREIEYLNDPRPKEATMHQYQAYYECCYTLLWMLGFVDNLYFPSVLCSDTMVVKVIFNYDSLEALLAQAKLRSKQELLDAFDLTQRYAWACDDARRLHFEMPAGLQHDVVKLRLRTLGWVVNESDQSWDDVETKIKALRVERKVNL